MPIVEITLFATIDHESGPVIADSDHVRRYVVSDGQWYGEGRNHVTFEVCPACPDPGTCQCECDEASVYQLTFTAANW